MNRRKFFRRGLNAVLIAIFLLSATVVGAKIQMYTASGEGYCYESESQDIAKQRAVDKAVKKATKQAGVYLKTYSRSVNSELTDDEVTAITSNAWQLIGEPKFTREIINHSGDTQIIVWTATVEVNVDDSEIQSWIKRDDQNKSTIITQTNEALKASEENYKKIEDLREKYNRATSKTEKNTIRKNMNDTDRDFLVNQKFEEALIAYYNGDFKGAIKVYTEAIELNPDNEKAWYLRGRMYRNDLQYELAIKDFTRAIELNPNYFEAYLQRALTYDTLQQDELAMADAKKAVELKPNNDTANILFTLIYDGINLRKRAREAIE